MCKLFFEKRVKFLVEVFNKEIKADYLSKEEVWNIKKFLALSGFFSKNKISGFDIEDNKRSK